MSITSDSTHTAASAAATTAIVTCSRGSREPSADLYGACAGDRQLLGDAPGQRTRKVVVPVRELAKPKSSEGVGSVGGVNIHAGAAPLPQLSAAIADAVRGCADVLRGPRSRKNASWSSATDA